MWWDGWHNSTGGINKLKEANEVFYTNSYRVPVCRAGHTQSGWQQKCLYGWMRSAHGESLGSYYPIRRDVWLSNS